MCVYIACSTPGNLLRVKWQRHEALHWVKDHLIGALGLLLLWLCFSCLLMCVCVGGEGQILLRWMHSSWTKPCWTLRSPSMPTANCSPWGSLLPLKVRTRSNDFLLIFAWRCSVKLALNILDFVLSSQFIVEVCVFMKGFSLYVGFLRFKWKLKHI